MIKIGAEIKQKKCPTPTKKKKSQNQYNLTWSLGEEKQYSQIMVQTNQVWTIKKDNILIKFDMIKNDIITDITEITKNNKGLQQTAISQ